MNQTTAIAFEEVLDEFRALGGIATNVRRASGRYGPGIFAVDSSLPVRLHAPEKLLIDPEDLEVRDGKLAVRAGSATGPAQRRLFETIHERFGWSAGGFEDLYASQLQWSRLPPDVTAFINSMGAILDPDFRFAEPTEAICLYQFVRSRDIWYRERAYVMPLVDFVNHSADAQPYVMEDGVGVAGTFPGEVFVRYNVSDPWGNLLTYGFADPSPYAYSLSLMVELFGTQKLSILRNVGSGEIRDDGIHYPGKRVDGNTIELSFVNLGNARQPDLPRAIFRKLLRDHITERQADDVFESIVRFNHSRFIEALRTLRRHDGPLVGMLEEAAINQLDALCASVGARSL